MITPSSDGSVQTRQALVAEMQARLWGQGWPRLTISLILIAAGGCAFLVSAASLWAGFVSMPWRYAVAAIAGYAAFVLLIRAWIALQRGSLDETVHAAGELAVDSAVDEGLELAVETTARGVVHAGNVMVDAARHAIASPTPSTLAPPALDPVEAPRAASSSPSVAKSGGGWFDLDADGLLWLVVAIVCALSALIAIVWVVYVAPVLLAEVALDAAVISTLYRRLRRQDVGHWAGAVLRRTWFPAMVVIIAMGLAGFALQKVVPDARSIGEVVSGLRR
jgi:hypothetical protein